MLIFFSYQNGIQVLNYQIDIFLVNTDIIN